MSKKIVRCCQGTWCSQYGSKRILETIEEKSGLKAPESSDTIDLDICRCLGYCSSGPNVEVRDEQTGNVGIVFYANSKTIMDEISDGGELQEEKGELDINLQDDFLQDI